MTSQHLDASAAGNGASGSERPRALTRRGAPAEGHADGEEALPHRLARSLPTLLSTAALLVVAFALGLAVLYSTAAAPSKAAGGADATPIEGTPMEDTRGPDERDTGEPAGMVLLYRADAAAVRG